MNVPLRAVAVVIKDNKILLMERVRKGKHYFAFIGGGVHEGENIETAVEREVLEEASLQVRAEKLLYKILYDKPFRRRSGQIVYLCTYLSGNPELGDGNEREIMSTKTNNYFKPRWIELKELPHLTAYPIEVRDWVLEDIKSNFSNDVRQIQIKIEELKR